MKSAERKRYAISLLYRIMLLSISWLFFNASILTAQPSVTFHNYNTSSGMSDNDVHCVLQDSRGFLWVGTNDGLDRFDGYEFIIYKKTPKDSASISGNDITALAESPDSLLYIGTADGGLCYYNFRTNRFIRLPAINPIHRFGNNNNILSIAFNKSGILYVSIDKGGLYRYNGSGKNFSNVDTIGSSVYSLFSCKNDSIYCGPVGDNIHRIGTNLHVFRGKITPQSYPFPYPAHTLNTIFEDSKGRIWCGAWDNELHLYKGAPNKFENFIFNGKPGIDYSGNEILSINQDANGWLWLGSRSGGLYFYDIDKKTFFQYLPSSETKSLTARHIQCIYHDKQNRMWLGTDEGLYVYDPLLNQFEVNYLPTTDGGDIPHVNDFLKDKNGTLYVATSTGLYTKKENENHFLFNKILYKNEPLAISSLFKDAKGRFYLGTNKSLFIYDPTSGSINTVPYFPLLIGFDFYNMAGSRVNCMAEWKHEGNTFLLASAYGYVIAIFAENNLKGNCFLPMKDSAFENLVRKIYVDTHNNLWILGATKGVIKVAQDEKFNSFLNNIQHPASLMYPGTVGLLQPSIFFSLAGKGKNISYPDAEDIIENSNYTFWVTTNGNGLYLFDPNNAVKPFTQFTSPFLSMEGLSKDKQGNLWIIASGGIELFDAASKSFFRFNQANGIPEQGVSGYFYKDAVGNLYAGGNGYFVRFNPDHIYRNTLPPPVFISHIKVMDKPADSLLLKDAVRLSYNENYLTFTFGAVNFTGNAANQYSYMLEGLDKDWRSNGTNRTVTYANLVPGVYTLRIKAANNDGVWNTNPTSLRIIIVPPFYQQWWFYTLCVLFVASLLYGFYRYRITQLEAMQKIRNKIARDLHDDIGSTLGSISFYSEAMNRNLHNDQREVADDIARKIGTSSREMIDQMSDIVWSVNAANDSMDQVAKRMKKFAEEQCSTNDIQMRFYADESVLKMKMEMEKRKNLFMIFKEAIYNSVKHSSCRTITIRLTPKGRLFDLLITDDGIGFNAVENDAYNGNGLKNMQQRADEIGAKLEIESGAKTGTTIQLILK